MAVRPSKLQLEVCAHAPKTDCLPHVRDCEDSETEKRQWYRSRNAAQN